MTVLAIVLLLVGFIAVLSQFGGSVEARDSLVWWIVAIFLVIAAVEPEVYRPIAKLLGIKFISNFILAGMIFFLFVHVFEQRILGNETRRRLRILISVEAATRFMAKKPKVASDKASVLVALPCYNEEANLESIIQALRALPEHPEFNIHYCVINDGSRDSSADILERLAPDNHLSHLINTGVAGVLLTAFEIARKGAFDWVVQCDADGQHPIDGIVNLVETARLRKADLLIGSRYLRSGRSSSSMVSSQSSTFSRRLGGLLILGLLRLLGPAKLSVSDPTSGFRAYSKKAYSWLLRDMPDEYPEPESIFILATKGFKIDEIEVAMSPRLGGQSSIFGFGSLSYMVKVISAIIGLKLSLHSRALLRLK